MYTPVYLKWITKKDLLYSMYMELCLMSCGSLDGTGAWGEKGYMCMHGWVPLLSTWNYHSIVNWLHLNTEFEKAMAPHSSTLAWKIPWMEKPSRLPSMGSLRVRHDRATSLSLFTFMHWRRKRQPTPVFLSGESQGRGSLVGCHLWGRTESDTTEVT